MVFKGRGKKNVSFMILVVDAVEHTLHSEYNLLEMFFSITY